MRGERIMKKTKKIISLLLTVLMIITALPLTAVNSFAADVVKSGTTGECTWFLDGTVLTISGNGKMEDYDYFEEKPWGTLITKAIIENGVTSIGKSAFNDCTSLTSITILDGVTSIGESAFEDCTSLTSVTIGNGVKSIGNSAFSGCKSLTNITIPDSITSIGYSAFGDTSYYNDESNWDNGMLYIGNHLIKAERGISGSVEIRQGTKTIADGAFAGTSATDIAISESVISVGGSAFADCYALVEINVDSKNANYSSENGVLFNKDKTEIVCYPEGKTDTSYSIPDSVTSIGESAFKGCTLESLIIPNSITSIGDSAFYECGYLKNIVIPDSVTSIGERAFGCCGITSITIPDSVTSIGDFVFECSSVNNIIIPDSVTSIGEGAFWLSGLTSITIPDSVTSIGNYAFEECAVLESVIIGNGVKSIGEGAFYWCRALESVTIGNSVTSIDYGAFYLCSSLKSVTIPGSVTSLGDSVFKNCTALKSAVFNKGATSTGICTFDGCTALESVTIENGVTSIGAGSFSGCTALESVTIGNGVTSIDNSAFYNCTSLASVTIPDSVTSIGNEAFRNSADSITLGKGIKYIGDYAFEGVNEVTVTGNISGIEGGKVTRGIKTLVLGKDVTDADDIIFDPFSDTLENIIVSEENTVYSSIDGVLFNKDKTELIRYPIGRKETSYKIPDGVTSVGKWVFSWCGALESVTLPNSVTSVGQEPFYNIDEVRVMGSIAGFEYGATVGVKNLILEKDVIDTDINFRDLSDTLENIIVSEENTVYSSIDGVLFNKDKTELIRYPKGRKETSYKIPDGVTSVGKWAFSWCGALESVTIPNSVTSVGYFAFNRCASLASITIPDSVTSVGPGAFYSCSALKNVAFPNSVTSVGSNVFDDTAYYNNKSNWDNGILYNGSCLIDVDSRYLNETSSIEIKQGTKTIADFAFYSCESLTSIAIPDSVISIGNYAFITCDDLMSVTIPESVKTIGAYAFGYSAPGSTMEIFKNDGFTIYGYAGSEAERYANENGFKFAQAAPAPTMSFPDVRSGDWYYDAVKYNFERGYITGYSNGTFGPANNIQRQDFALILARIAGADLSAYEGQNGGFSDVPSNEYYSAAVAWAKDRGIVTGYSADNFGVGTYISREQICLIFSRYFGGEATGDVDAIVQAYPDGGNTSPWAKAGVAWAIENGIVGNAGYINPIGNAGRAEVAQIIYNMANKGMI